MSLSSASRTPNQTVAGALGAVYLLVGLLGFAVTGGVDFAGEHGTHLLGIFEVNPLHNVVHLGVGIGLLAASRQPRLAAGANSLVGAVYLLVGLAGPAVSDSSADILALNAPDHLLHLGSAVVLLAVGLRGLGSRQTAVSMDSR